MRYVSRLPGNLRLPTRQFDCLPTRQFDRLPTRQLCCSPIRLFQCLLTRQSSECWASPVRVVMPIQIQSQQSSQVGGLSPQTLERPKGRFRLAYPAEPKAQGGSPGPGGPSYVRLRHRCESLARPSPPGLYGRLLAVRPVYLPGHSVSRDWPFGQSALAFRPVGTDFLKALPPSVTLQIV